MRGAPACLSKRKRRLDSLEDAQGAPRDPRRVSVSLIWPLGDYDSGKSIFALSNPLGDRLFGFISKYPGFYISVTVSNWSIQINLAKAFFPAARPSKRETHLKPCFLLPHHPFLSSGNEGHGSPPHNPRAGLMAQHGWCTSSREPASPSNKGLGLCDLA